MSEDWEFREAVSPGELTAEMVPRWGEMPEYGRGLPPEQEVATSYHRLVFGDEEDPDRALVPVWRQVDDLGGLSPLWGGEVRGKLFLHAGKEPPQAGAPEDDDLRCALVAEEGIDGSPQVWRSGVPHLPYHFVPMGVRDKLLKTESGAWRLLDWEPLGVFDVERVNPEFIEPDSALPRTIVCRYTLWCVLVGNFVVLYTTAADWGSALMVGGAPMRWPFGRSMRKNRLNLGYDMEQRVYGSHWSEFLSGEQDVEMPLSFVRCSPLPWQFEGGGELEVVTEEREAFGGLADGQFYAAPAVSVVPRFLLPNETADPVWALMNEAYLAAGAATGNFGFYARLDKKTVEDICFKRVPEHGTRGYSIDPIFMEELGRFFPDGAEEGMIWTTRPNSFRRVFSLHVDEGASLHPELEQVAACPHCIGLLTAASSSGQVLAGSVAVAYNYGPFLGDDEEKGFIPSGSDEPEDDPEFEGGGGESGGGSGGGGESGGGDGGEGGGTGVKWLGRGYFYEAGNGVDINRTWLPSERQGVEPGWRFEVYVRPVTGHTTVNFLVQLDVSTKNDSLTYDWPDRVVNGAPAPVYGLSMFYGVSTVERDDRDFNVSWRSSYQGRDILPKSASASKTAASEVDFSVHLGGVQVSSSSPPGWCEGLNFLKVGEFTKRGTYRVWNKFEQKWVNVRYEKTFDRYRVSVNESVVLSIGQDFCATRGPVLTGATTPAEIVGQSDDLEGPKVSAVAVSAVSVESGGVVKLPRGMAVFEPEVVADFGEMNRTFTVKGGSSWNVGKKDGSIDGFFFS